MKKINEKGYSLIELMVFLSILVVLIGIVSISIFHSSRRHKLQRAIWEVHTQMNYARYKAVLGRTKFRISFGTNRYAIERYDDEARAWKNERGNILDGVYIQANNSPIFHPQGTVSNLASILVSNAAGRYKITLAISGRIKVVSE
jgi:Tfp pilus assembly protein FimT